MSAVEQSAEFQHYRVRLENRPRKKKNLGAVYFLFAVFSAVAFYLLSHVLTQSIASIFSAALSLQ